jgi:hypothetical protein
MEFSEVRPMNEREEGYRAGREARAGFVGRSAKASRPGADAVTRMVDAAVYRYEHEMHDHIEPTPDESTSDEDGKDE